MFAVSKRITGWIALVLVALAVAAAPAQAETARNLIRKYGSEAQYNLSIIPELLRSNANVFFVDNEHTNATDAADGRHGHSPDQPFKTYDYAVGKCTASQNNIIIVMPYSVERYTAAGSVDVDVSSITTIGLGYGPARPKFIFDHADATFVVGRDGDGATFMNLVWQASVTGVTVGIQIEDGADNISFVDCEVPEGEAAVDEFLTTIDVVTEANDLSLIRFRAHSADAAGATTFLDIGDGVVTRLLVQDCLLYGDWGTACFFSDQSNIDVMFNNTVMVNINTDEYGIEFQGTGNRGVVRGCTFVTSGNYVDMGGLQDGGGNKTDVYAQDSDTISYGSYSLADGGITAAKIANAAIDAATFAVDALAAIQSEVGDAIDANNLDHLAGLTTGVAADADLEAYAVEGSLLAHLASVGADITTFKPTTDSLEALGTATAAIQAVTDDLAGISQIGDKVQVDMDANSVLYWQPRVSSVTADEVSQDLFAVAGGPIQILEFYGVVDVVIGANGTTCKIISDATAGAAYDNEFTTAVAITDDAAGTLYVFTAANPSVLTPLTGGGASGGTNFQVNWYCPIGAIEQTMSADPGGAAGDHITWYMVWRPLAAGVTVTAQ